MRIALSDKMASMKSLLITAILLLTVIPGPAPAEPGKGVSIDPTRNDRNPAAPGRNPDRVARNRRNIGEKWNPGHYIQVTHESTPAYLEEILSNPNNQIRGVKTTYSWAELERNKDRYDFSSIETHLGYARKYNKQLFVTVSDRTFKDRERVIPEYLDRETRDGGGERTPGGGYVARLWDPAIMGRSNKLIQELGKRFDGDPNFEGITFMESSLNIGRKRARGYSDKAYADALISRIDAAAKAFQNSVVLMYMNWGPPELLDRVINHMSEAGVGLACPDLVPDRGRFGYKPRIPAYDYFPRLAGRIPLGVAVQSENLLDPEWFFRHCRSKPNDSICKEDKEGNYEKRKGSFEMEDFWNMALNTLKVNYIFWVPVELPRFKFKFRSDILPSINAHKGEINRVRPK